MEKALIEIRTGSDSDIPKIREAYEALENLNIPYSPRILSAHRTPHVMVKQAQSLFDDGFLVSIAAAGGSAHLPGMTASETLVPVIGIPVKGSNLEGQDSLYSIIQMPNGIPVGCVAVGEAKNAALLAGRIANLKNEEKPVVMILKASDDQVDQAKYDEMLSLGTELGLIVSESETEEAQAIIALQHLANTESFPGSISKKTDLPVIALPVSNDKVKSSDLTNDTLQKMLTGYPLAGMGINRYLNAILFAAQIIGLKNPEVQEKLKNYREGLAKTVKTKDERLQNEGVKSFL